MHTRSSHSVVMVVLAACLVAGCGKDGEQAAPTAVRAASPQAVAPSIAASSLPGRSDANPSADGAGIDAQVWRVRASSAVAAGTLYVFLPDGTLLVASPGSTLASGSWKQRTEGGITMVEESLPYAVDVLELSAQRLRLRSHNPGTPVDITLEPVQRAGSDVPRAFIGEWTALAQDCGKAGAESRLRIGADRIRLHEASGPWAAVLPAGASELAVVAKVAGEGQERLLHRRYRLSADGSKLADVTDGPTGGMVRGRCA